MSKVGLNWAFVRRLWRILWLVSKPPNPSCAIILLLLPALFTEQVAVYYIGLVPSGFYSVLENRDKPAFYQQLYQASVWVLAVVLIKSAKTYGAGALYIQWRWTLTCSLHDKYFSRKLYYQLNCLNHGIDNPDMRITQDVDRLTNTLQSVILQLLVFPGVVGYYTYKCYHTMGWLGPVCIYSYFLLSCLCNKLLMTPIVRGVFELERREGHFRYLHVNLRTEAESAAFCDAERTEHDLFQSAVRGIMRCKQLIVTKQLFLSLAVNTCDYLGSILSYIIIAIPIFQGKYDDVEYLGTVISKNAFVAMYLVYAFSSTIDLSGSVADLAGYTHRVGELLEFLAQQHKLLDTSCKEEQEEEQEGDEEAALIQHAVNTTIEISETGTDYLVMENVTVLNPLNGNSLVQALCITISQHSNVLIHGPPGAGKSSVLRSIKKLWPPLTGSISSHEDILFLPQRPYFSSNSLRAQISMPSEPDPNDQRYLSILNKLQLSSVLEETVFVERKSERRGWWEVGRRAPNTPQPADTHVAALDKIPEQSWYKTLTPGQQQLLAVARVLYHRPALIILDEATSAVSGEYTDLIYRTLQEIGCGYLSVSHDEGLEQYHDQVIVLVGDGESWYYKPAPEEQLSRNMQ